MRFVIECKISKRPPYPAPGRVNISADQLDGSNVSKGGHPSARVGSQRYILGAFSLNVGLAEPVEARP
jgi:hypothetical protein